MLFAERDGRRAGARLLAAVAAGSAGFVGVSDGWQDLSRHKRLAWRYERAENGNVALIGEIDLAPCDGAFVLALGFGSTPAEAGHRTRWSLTTASTRRCDRVRRRLARLAAPLLPLDAAPSAGRPQPLPRQHRRPAHPRGSKRFPAA